MQKPPHSFPVSAIRIFSGTFPSNMVATNSRWLNAGSSMLFTRRYTAAVSLSAALPSCSAPTPQLSSGNTTSGTICGGFSSRRLSRPLISTGLFTAR